jgi:hypothetical protein
MSDDGDRVVIRRTNDCVPGGEPCIHVWLVSLDAAVLHFEASSLGAALRYETETSAMLTKSGQAVILEDLTSCSRCNRRVNCAAQA